MQPNTTTMPMIANIGDLSSRPCSTCCAAGARRVRAVTALRRPHVSKQRVQPVALAGHGPVDFCAYPKSVTPPRNFGLADLLRNQFRNASDFHRAGGMKRGEKLVFSPSSQEVLRTQAVPYRLRRSAQEGSQRVGAIAARNLFQAQDPRAHQTPAPLGDLLLGTTFPKDSTRY